MMVKDWLRGLKWELKPPGNEHSIKFYPLSGKEEEMVMVRGFLFIYSMVYSLMVKTNGHMRSYIPYRTDLVALIVYELTNAKKWL